MKNSRKVIVTTFAFLVVIFTTSFCACTFSGKRCYKTYTGNYVTIWEDYIILEKFERNEPPKNNYILQKGQYRDGDVRLVVKNNDSIIIFRRCSKDSLDVVFTDPDYKVEIYGNTWNDYQEFKKRTSYSDPLINYEFFYCPYDRIVTISECIGDSVYTRDYGEWPGFYKEHVRSRYDKALNK